MATPRKPYVSVRLGIVEDAIAAGVSSLAALLLLRLLTHKLKRSIPGLLPLGVAGLAESLNESPSEVAGHLTELEQAHLVVVDRVSRLIYVLGAIDSDGPRSPKALRGMALQYLDMPANSPVAIAVRRAIEATLTGDDATGFRGAWSELVGHQGPCDDDGKALGVDVPRPLTDPYSDPYSDPAAAAAADPSPADPFLRAWSRLPNPPFAAAAAVDFYTARKRFSVEEFAKLVRALGASKWVQGEGDLKIVPTLAALSNKVPYARRIIRGEFASRTATWRCAECGVDHDPTGDCPPVCRDCQTPHEPDRKCRQQKDREEWEEAERARESGVAAKGIAAMRAKLRVGRA